MHTCPNSSNNNFYYIYKGNYHHYYHCHHRFLKPSQIPPWVHYANQVPPQGGRLSRGAATVCCGCEGPVSTSPYPLIIYQSDKHPASLTLFTLFILFYFFYNAGEVGDWKNHFSPEQSREMDEVFNQRLAGTRLGAKLDYQRHCQ